MTRLSRLLGSVLLALPLAAQAAIFTLGGGPGQLVMFGLEADTPPASADGAIFIEVDTAKIFLRTGGNWVEQLNDSYALPGGSGVDTANSPNANEVARFTDADTIEGRTAAEFKADLDLEVGTDLQAQDSDLASIAALTTSAHGRGLLDDADPAASRTSLGLGTAATAASTDFGPVGVDYLVGTANGTLTGEIAVGTAPGGELGGTWASPTVDDTLGVTDWTLTSPNYAAGSTTASSWPNYTSGTVLTTAEDGALEVDADTLYFTTDAGNRGVVPVQHWIRAASDQTLTSTTNAQQIFDSPANGQITLETGTYMFELHLQITGMSGTSGNGQILFAGTGTFADWNWRGCGLDNSTLTTISADLCAYFLTNASAASIVTAATGTALRVYAWGSFECSVAGTLIPQIDLVTAAAATIESGSFLRLKRVGAASMTNIGQWD